jgi:hypothetical protein
MAGNIIKYTAWPIIPPNMKAMVPTTSENLHSQSDARRTNDPMQGIKILIKHEKMLILDV